MQNQIRTYTVIGIVLFLLGVIVVQFSDPFLPSAISNTKKGYQTGFTAAKTLVENSSLGSMIQTHSEIRTLSGTVTEVNGTQLTLHVRSMNPFADQSLADRIVLIDTSTKVSIMSQKDPKMFQSEMNSYAKSAKANDAQPATLPSPFITTPATVSSIAVGVSVSVTAAESIGTLKEFTASQIQIQSAPSSLTNSN